MALGDRYFEYTKKVYNEWVIYPPLPIQAAAAPPVSPPSSGSREQKVSEQIEKIQNQLQRQWIEGVEYEKENENEDQNSNRGVLFILGVITRAIVKPFALVGALLGDLIADIIRLPVDLVRGIINPSADIVDKTPYEQAPNNKQEHAPSAHYTPPTDLYVNREEAQELVGKITDDIPPQERETAEQSSKTMKKK